MQARLVRRQQHALADLANVVAQQVFEAQVMLIPQVQVV